MVSQQDLDSLAALDAVVRSEAFIGKCEDFLGVNCVQFDTDDHHGENKLEWTEIHNQYQALVDAELSGAVPEEAMGQLMGSMDHYVKFADGTPEQEQVKPYMDVVELLSTFTDFQLFKGMMIGRHTDKKEGRANPGLAGMLSAGQMMEAAMGADHVTSDNAAVTKILDDAQEMYTIAKADGWELYVEKPTFTFSLINYQNPTTGKKSKYSKQLMLIDLPIQGQARLFLDYGPERAKFDDGITCKNCQIIKQLKSSGGTFTDDDVIVNAEWTMIPKALRWAMGLGENFPIRITSKQIDPDGTIAYAFIMWDLEKDAPSKKLDIQETGILKPNPEDPTKSYCVAVSKMPWYVPGWLMGKMMEPIMNASIKPLVKAYEKNMLGKSASE